MKALRFDRIGDLAALNIAEMPVPEPANGEVLVQIAAAGLNPSDVKNVLGRFPYTTLPRTPGRDFAGTVVKGPSELIGAEVWGTGRELGFTRDGSHAGYVTLPADGVAIKPTALSFAQAAGCGVPYTTAWDALERTGVSAGTRLLVIGAAGSVGTAALALAGWRGADVVAAVRRPEQAARLSANGTTTVPAADAGSFAAAVRDAFRDGPEVIFDTTGFWLPESVAMLARFGRIAVIAAPSDGHVRLPVLALYRKGGSVVGVNSLLYDTIACARMLERIGSGFDDGMIPLPSEPRHVLLTAGLEAYHEIDRGSTEKIVFIPA